MRIYSTSLNANFRNEHFSGIIKYVGYCEIPFTFLEINLLVFNKNSQNHDEYIVKLFLMNKKSKKNSMKINSKKKI